MRRIAALSLIPIFVLTVMCSAQSSSSRVQNPNSSLVTPADTFVRTSTTIPNFLDKNDGWTLDSTEAMSPNISKETYINTQKRMFVFLAVQTKSNGSREELFIQYGSENVGRNAIKVGGTWYIAKGPFFDYGTINADNDFQSEEVKDSKGNPSGIKLSLDVGNRRVELVVNF